MLTRRGSRYLFRMLFRCPHSARVLGWSLFISYLGCNPAPPPEITDPGQLIYLGYADKYAQCSRCHGPEGQGGMFGPGLRGVVQKRGIDSVRQVILLGRGKGENRMPGFANELSEMQIEQVMAFVASLRDSLQDSTAATREGH